MKIRNTGTPELTPQLNEVLEAFRARRVFDPHEYLDAKTSLLEGYLEHQQLDTIIVANSGGVDSAVVSHLTAHTAQHSTQLRRIVYVTWPVSVAGTTGQADAARVAFDVGRSAAQLCADTDVTVDIIAAELGAHCDALDAAITSATGLSSDPWALGQLASNIRTPANYHIATLLWANGYRSVVAGTTNYDEGAWLGYIGKVADAAVDLQLISDIHKSEVYQVAEVLGVPQEARTRTPAGDMFDHACDETVFGARYDFVELYHHWLACDAARQTELIDELDSVSRAVWDTCCANLERLRAHNAHKYLASSPAVHLDVYTRDLPGGWKVNRWPHL